MLVITRNNVLTLDRLPWTSDRPVAEASTSSNKQQSQHTNSHAHRGIQTRNPSERTAAGLSLRACDHWNRILVVYWLQDFKN